MKVFKGSVIIDPSMIRFLKDQELGEVLALLVKVSLKGSYRIYIATSPFNANIVYRNSRVYRVSVSYGAFIAIPSQAGRGSEDLGDTIGRICHEEDLRGRLCWRLNEDVWADVRILIPRVSLDKSRGCPRAYEESIARLGFDIAGDARARVLCLSGGDRITIEDPMVNHLIIPIDADNHYKEYLIARVGGYRHPIEALLMGRRVVCSDHKDLDLPSDSKAIVESIGREPLLHTIYDRVYVFSCTPSPEDLLFRVSLIYASTHPER